MAGGVLHHIVCRVDDILVWFRDGWERGPDNPLCCPHCILQRPQFGGGAIPEPDCNAVAENVLDGSSLEGCKDGRGKLDFFSLNRKW